MAAAKSKKAKARKSGAPYYPPRTFDDDLVALVALYTKRKWAFSNVDLKQLAVDSKDQRDERTKFDEVEGEYLKLRHDFGEAQAERHARFSSALNAARGAFKNDKSVMTELGKFKRSVTRAKKPATAKA